MSDHLAGYYTTLYSYNSLIVSICAYNKGFPILPRCTFFIRTRQVYFVTTDYHSNGYIFSSLPGCPDLEASRGAAREINSETFIYNAVTKPCYFEARPEVRPWEA